LPHRSTINNELEFKIHLAKDFLATDGSWRLAISLPDLSSYPTLVGRGGGST